MNDVVEIIQETTDWEYPNHEYHLNSKGKLVAYKPVSKELIVLNKPLAFDKRRRTFKKVDIS